MSEGGRLDVPAHRVIAAGGRLGGYGGHEQLKRALLMAEGVRMRGTRVAIEECRWQRSSRKAASRKSQSG
jgi:alkylated DNA nucleotide flippase Atl1